jgi:hypothetical protein
MLENFACNKLVYCPLLAFPVYSYVHEEGVAYPNEASFTLEWSPLVNVIKLFDIITSLSA